MGIKLVPIHRALAKDEWNNIYKILCTGLRKYNDSSQSKQFRVSWSSGWHGWVWRLV